MKISFAVICLGLFAAGCSRNPDRSELIIIEHPSQLVSWWKNVHAGSPHEPFASCQYSILQEVVEHHANSDEPMTIEEIRSAVKAGPISKIPGPPPAPPPEQTQTEIPSINWNAAKASLDLRPVGTTRVDGQPAVLLKNMRTVKKGDTISTVYEDRLYEWRITSVTGGVIEIAPIKNRNKE